MINFFVWRKEIEILKKENYLMAKRVILLKYGLHKNPFDINFLIGSQPFVTNFFFVPFFFFDDVEASSCFITAVVPRPLQL